MTSEARAVAVQTALSKEFAKNKAVSGYSVRRTRPDQDDWIVVIYLNPGASAARFPTKRRGVRVITEDIEVHEKGVREELEKMKTPEHRILSILELVRTAPDKGHLP